MSGSRAPRGVLTPPPEDAVLSSVCRARRKVAPNEISTIWQTRSLQPLFMREAADIYIYRATRS